MLRHWFVFVDGGVGSFAEPSSRHVPSLVGGIDYLVGLARFFQLIMII